MASKQGVSGRETTGQVKSRLQNTEKPRKLFPSNGINGSNGTNGTQKMEENDYAPDRPDLSFNDFTTATATSSSVKKSIAVVERFDSTLFRKRCFNVDETYEIVYVHKITIQVTSTQHENIIKSIKLNVLSSDASDICSIQEDDGSFSEIHDIILEHLKIQSINEAIEGLTFFVVPKDFELEDSKNCILKSLKDCDTSIWITALVIKYLESVLDEQQSEWDYTYKKGNEWIREQLSNDQYMDQCIELLFFASEEYLIKQGIEVRNTLGDKYAHSIEGDDGTIEAIKEIFSKSATNVEDINELIDSQRSDGYFECHELVYGSFKIPLSDRHIENLKTLTDKICLRRLDKKVWISSLVIVFFEKILHEYESEWKSAYDNAKEWISQEVRNSEYEDELYKACTKYLYKKSYDYLF